MSGKTVRASRSTSPPPYRLERCVSASSRTPASRATPRRLERGRVLGLPRPLAPRPRRTSPRGRADRRRRRVDDVVGRRRVAGEHELASRPGGAEHLVGRHDPSVRERHRLAAPGALPAPGPNGTPSASAAATSKRPGRSLLDERVAERVAAVADRERAQLVAVARQRRSRRQLDHGDLVGQPAEDPPQRVAAARPALAGRRASAAPRARAARTSSASRAGRGSDRRGSASGRPRRRSTSPTSERSSWRCVPSPQSNRRRSPPRRTSVAEGARRAVGIEPAVPRKTTSRSMPPILVSAVHEPGCACR